MSWWVAELYSQGAIVLLTAQIFWVIFSICLHELAHGWAAIWQGDDTPRRLGHMTLNPLVHMGSYSLIVFIMTGFAWGLMPTDPSRYRWGPRGHIVVSGAGPAMNLLLALIALTFTVLWLRFGDSTRQPLFDNVTTFFFFGGAINVALAILNLLPVPPLDGSSVLAGVSRPYARLIQQPNALLVGMFILIVILATPIGGEIVGAGHDVAEAYVKSLDKLLG